MKNIKSALLLIALFVSKSLSASVYLPDEDRAELNQKFLKISLQAMKASGGADIVGNGGGAVEQASLYIYRSLDRYISQCLNNKDCYQDSERREVLKKIREVVLKNREEKNRLVFLSGENFEKYMQDELDPEIRVAKTGFSDEFPIFINLAEAHNYPKDSLYASMVALLVHEIGHQVGVASHSYLDDLALSVRSMMEANTKEFTYDVLGNQFVFTLFASSNQYDFAQYVLEYNGEKYEVPSLMTAYKCTNGDKLVGANLENLYWEKGRTANYHYILSLNAWGEFACERKNKTVYFEQINVRLTWDFTLERLPGEKYVFLLNEMGISLK
ncbi:hypothetical protein DOM21_18450 [Bacteriovorax stolpii]|uniref:hypothetical protein n=1 Tax=Bacteriovorax stolpii TaxID=960 RepID=UPI00115B767D|nr:hypothetical protein [Bacteriovorax stolpii]QDK43396.1 hypothetical protein DOM21_18450 [Bacteriovorax stolpii]